jgi:hypothetical protein
LAFYIFRKQEIEGMNHHKASVAQVLFLFIEKKVKDLIGFFGLGNSRLTSALSKVKARLKKHVRTTALENIDICVAEHCNLGCYSCNHFSQLAKPEFADLKSTEADLKRLAELSGGGVPSISLAGGEPLLNPDLPEFMRISRQYFPKSRVQIITNGLLLLAQKDIFWESLKKYDIAMTPTKYPGIDWDKIEARAAGFGYKITYFDLTGSSEKVSRKFCLDLSGGQDAKKSFMRCSMAFCTAAIKNGRMATCSFVFNMRHFNNYFHQHVPVTDLDSVDIYKVKDMRELIRFLRRPIPLCRFCKSMGGEVVGRWRKTENSIQEWT